jgi:hypothetical protein
VLQLTSHKTGMNAQRFSESKNVTVRERWIFTRDEMLQRGLRYTEVSRRFIRNALLLRNVASCSSPTFLQFDIQQCDCTSVLSQYVLDFMPENKPKVIDAIKSQ